MKKNLVSFVLVVGIFVLAGFATDANAFFFSNTVTAPGTLSWTHTLENEDFDPELSGGEVIEITDAALNLDVYVDRNEDDDPTEVVIVTGDGYYLGNFVADSAGNYTPSFSLNELVRNAIEEDWSLNAVIELVFSGSATVNSSELVGNGSVVPIPGSLLLLGSGLVCVVGLRRKFRG